LIFADVSDVVKTLDELNVPDIPSFPAIVKPVKLAFAAETFTKFVVPDTVRLASVLFPALRVPLITVFPDENAPASVVLPAFKLPKVVFPDLSVITLIDPAETFVELKFVVNILLEVKLVKDIFEALIVVNVIPPFTEILPTVNIVAFIYPAV